MLKQPMASTKTTGATRARRWLALRWLASAGAALAVLGTAALVWWPGESADAQGTTWTARIEIYTSFRDANGDGVNDYNPGFTVTLNRTDDTVGASCPQSIAFAPRIGTAGADFSNGSQIIAGETHTAVDLSADCTYDVAWPDGGVLTGVQGRDGFGEVDVRQVGGGTRRISAGVPTAQASYRDSSMNDPGTLTFDPPLTFAAQGSTFEVQYEATSTVSTSCRLPEDRSIDVYTIGAGGVPTLTTSARRAWAGGSQLGMLYESPAHESGSCRYIIRLPEIENYTKPSSEPVVSSTGGATISYTAAGAETFVPNVMLTVPSIDVDGTAGPDFVGATIRLTFSRTAGPATGCSPNNTPLTWTIGSDGTTATIETDGSLVDYPPGGSEADRCEYSVGFPTSANRGFRRASIEDATISAADNSAAATYETSATTFDATFVVTGPALIHVDGHDVSPAFQRRVGFSYARRSAMMGCTETGSHTETFEAGRGFTHTESGIVDFPRGYTQVSDRCIYDITWDAEVPTDLTLDPDAHPFRDLEIALATGASPTFDGANASPAATYELAATNFEPPFSITVPAANAAGTTNSLFAGTRFTLNYTRVGGPIPPTDCSPGGSRDYIVRSNGNVSPDVPAGQRFELVDKPQGETVGCIYEFTFPSSASSASGAAVTWELTRRGNETTRVNADSPNQPRQYLPSANIEFAPQITLVVPQVDIDGTAGNDFAGTASRIALSLTRASGPTTGCSSGTHDYVISDAGAAAPATSGLTFVNVPANEATQCVYTVGFPTNNQDGLLVSKTEATDNDSLSGTDTTAMATYETAERPFTATFTASAPAAADGATFALSAARASGAHANCLATFTADLAIGATGTSQTTRANVADWPRGYTTTADRCSYDVTWPYAETVASGTLATLRRTTETATVSGAAATADATYVTNVFQPSITITAPPVDVDGTAGNDLAGQQFAVTITKPGQHADCSDGGPVTYAIAANGDVSPSTDVPTLIDIPEGQSASCIYTVEFPDNDDGNELVRKIDAATDDTMTQLSDPAAMVTYETVATNFTLTLNVTAPASGATKQVTAGVTPTSGSHPGCEGLTSPQTLTFDANGMASSTHTVVDWPRGHTVDTDRCSYDIAWSPTEVTAAGALPTLAVSETDSVLVVNHATPTAIGTYLDRTVFQPAITITVPPVNVDGTTTNLFSGTTFEVMFDKKAGEGPAQGCEPLRRDYVVDDNGDVAPTRTPVLTDVPGGATESCVYTVSFPSTRASASSAPVSWELAAQDTADGEVRASALALTRAYVLTRAVTFTPDVTITVPQLDASPSNSAHAGATFDVEFTRSSGPMTGCETTSASYSVQPDGTVSGTPPALVNVPADGTEGCVYAVGLPDTVASAGGTLNLVGSVGSAGSPTPTVRASANAVEAGYQTTFTPAVTIEVPQYGRDGAAGTNYYEGATFAVGIAPTAGANAGCVAPVATVNYVVAADGTVGPAAAPAAAPVLPDALAGLGAAERCSYVLTFPDPVTSAQGATPAWTLNRGGAETGDVSATASAITRSYTAPLTNFTPSVVVNVPFIDANGDDVNDLSTLAVTVSYTLAAADPPQDANCTPTPAPLTETYTIGAGRRAAPNDELSEVTVGTALMLVDRPAGVDVRCVYAVEVTDVTAIDQALPVRSESAAEIDGGTTLTITYSASRRSLPLLVSGVAPSERIAVPIATTRSDGDSLVGIVPADSQAQAGFVPTEEPLLPVTVTLTLPEAEFAADAAVEVLLNSPGVCGSDMAAFGGVPAEIGLAYAVGAGSGGEVAIVSASAHMLPAFAERDGEQQPCVLRVTVLTVPEGCELSDAAIDDAGRSYVELSWSETLESFAVSPTFTCG